MKRMVTYLYEYRSGMKGTGAGFLKLDSRGNDWRVQLCLQEKKAGEEPGKVYFVVKQRKTMGVLLGELTTGQGMVGGSWIVSRDGICGSPWSFADVEGVAVQYTSGRYLAGSWIEEPDEGFLKGNFSIWGEDELPEDSGQEERLDEPDEPGEPEEPNEPEKPIVEDFSEQTQVQLQSTEQQGESHTVDRIDISDIRRFPKRNWHLCSNSFVIHGFFNYHYLVCIHREEDGVSRQYLGVPGVYEKPERAMAMLFGFPEFEDLQQTNEPPEGAFGYWCCQLEQ